MSHGLARELRWICKHDSFSVEGCVTCAAADKVERVNALRAQVEALRTALLDIDQCAQRRGDKYLCDCIDNSGAPYQSQWLADLLAAARAGGGKP